MVCAWMPDGVKHGRNTTTLYTLGYSTGKNARAKHLEDEKILVKASERTGYPRPPGITINSPISQFSIGELIMICCMYVLSNMRRATRTPWYQVPHSPFHSHPRAILCRENAEGDPPISDMYK